MPQPRLFFLENRQEGAGGEEKRREAAPSPSRSGAFVPRVCPSLSVLSPRRAAAGPPPAGGGVGRGVYGVSHRQGFAAAAQRGAEKAAQPAEAGGAAGQRGEEGGGGSAQLGGGAQRRQEGAAQPQRRVQGTAEGAEVEEGAAAGLPQQAGGPAQQGGGGQGAEGAEGPEQGELAGAEQQQRRVQGGQSEAEGGQQQAQPAARQPLPARQARQAGVRLGRPQPARARPRYGGRRRWGGAAARREGVQRAQPGPQAAAAAPRLLLRAADGGLRRGGRAGGRAGGGGGLRLRQVLLQLPAQVRHGGASSRLPDSYNARTARPAAAAVLRSSCIRVSDHFRRPALTGGGARAHLEAVRAEAGSKELRLAGRPPSLPPSDLLLRCHL